MNYQNGSPALAALPVDLYRLSADDALRELDAPRAGLTVGMRAMAKR